MFVPAVLKLGLVVVEGEVEMTDLTAAAYSDWVVAALVAVLVDALVAALVAAWAAVLIAELACVVQNALMMLAKLYRSCLV